MIYANQNEYPTYISTHGQKFMSGVFCEISEPKMVVVADVGKYFANLSKDLTIKVLLEFQTVRNKPGLDRVSV